MSHLGKVAVSISLVLACALAVSVPLSTAGTQRLTRSQQQIVARVRELQAEIEELLPELPAAVQADLRRQLAEAPASAVAVTPVTPAAPGVVAPTSIVAAGFSEVLVLDLAGDGLDLGGEARIQAGGRSHQVTWTRGNTDDAFLVVRLDSLRREGFELRSSQGEPLSGQVLVSDGTDLQGPDGRQVAIRSAWELIDELDSNDDGRFDASDAGWRHVGLFVDRNADGRMHAGEVMSLRDGAVGSLTEGVFTREKGSIGIAAGVVLR